MRASSPCTPDGALALIRDITERKRLQREVLEVSDREQRRLGQDLHDGVGQLLVGIALMLKRQEQTTADAAARANLAEIGRHLQRAIAQTRSVAKGLYAVDFDLEGLGAALEELASNAEAMFRVRCAAHLAARPVSRAPKHATAHLIRVAREAVANAAKHAQASRIDITLEEEPGAIVLRVRDDGCGFDVEETASKSNPGGMGIHLMRYRASLMEATLNLESRQNEGTTVTCRVPVDVAAARGTAVSA
jgi:two-component system, LuxR family, sensor kinase FixL